MIAAACSPAASRLRRGVAAATAGLIAAGGAASAAGPSPQPHAMPDGSPPNVLLIIAEDLGPTINAYGDGTVSTPHLDALAERGVRYARAHTTAPTCSPARAGILTGLYPHANGQYGLAHLGYRMHRGVPFLPALLEEAGYRTGRMGKLHVGSDENESRMLQPIEWDLDKRDIRAFTDPAGRFMAASDEPFFVKVSFPDAHRPFRHQHAGYPEDPVSADDIAGFTVHAGLDNERIRDDAAGYYNAVQRVDKGVGMLIDHLEEAGKLDETIVIFTADHGPAFTRGKLSLYEFGTHVPLIFAGPGIVEGSVVDDLALNADITPTVLAMTGQPPLEVAHGKDLSPQLRGEPVTPRETIVTEYLSHGPGKWFPMRAVQDGRYKLIVNYLPGRGIHTSVNVDGSDTGRLLLNMSRDEVPEPHRQLMDPVPFELYDLENDPAEQHNLAGELDARPELADAYARLAKALEQWQVDTVDPLIAPGWARTLAEHHGDANEGEAKRIDMGRFVLEHPVTLDDYAKVVSE